MTEHPKVDYDALIPEMREWNEGRGIDIDSWIYCEGDLEHAIGYGRLLWPPFREHDDGVFFESAFDLANYDAWMMRTGGDRQAVEAVMNHRHLAQVFAGHSDAPTREQILHFGRLLAETWSAKLHRDFPLRRFRVELLADDAEDLDDIQITFRQAESAG